MKKGGPAPTSKGHKQETGGGPAPAAKGPKQETVGATTSTHPKASDHPSLTKAEITAIVEKTVSEALTRQMSEFQAEITKSTKQQAQDVNARLLELGNKSLDANAKCVKSFKEVEDTLSGLNQRCGLLEKLVREKLDSIVEEKVRLILRKVHPDAEVEEDKKQWSEQLARSDAIHQEEIQKLHQQHHQDMLSVINDCCRKLKSSFTRQNKPYDVGEIHTTIDDIQQKMIREILSEIEKTDTAHEDLSSFEEALTKSELSHEVGQGREFSRLSSDEITASLDAFEVENIGSFGQELESLADVVAAADAEREPAVEENISASRSMITGDRGNLYYTEELKRTVDDMIALGGGTPVVNPIETEPSPDFPPRTQSEVEESLESLIITGVADNRFDADVESLISKDMEKKDKAVDPNLGGKDKTSDIFPETTSLDLDQLKSLEAMAEGDFSWTDIQPSKIEPEESKPLDADRLKSLEAKAEGDFGWPDSQPSSKIEPEKPKPFDADLLKSLEAKAEGDIGWPDSQRSSKIEPEKSTPLDADRLKSLEAKAEGDLSWTDIQPSSKIEPEKPKSCEAAIQPVTTTSTTSPQDRGKSVAGKVQLDESAESAQDRDQMKALEAMLEAQMTESPDTEGKNISHTEPTKSAKQQLKANVSEQVTTSALQTTETIKVTPRTGYDENPHYVEEVLSAAQSKAKDKP